MTATQAPARDVAAVYDEVTDGLRRPLRVSELVYAVADRFPDRLPSRRAIDGEREHLQRDKQGLEIAQGAFVAEVLADPVRGLHLLHAMARPLPEALERLPAFAAAGSVDLGPVRLDRDGPLGRITLQGHATLNAEDDDAVHAMEVAIDLVLLDDAIEIGVLRGGVCEHPRYAGRRVLGSGVNLSALYRGRISLVEFMLERELGYMAKVKAGHAPEAFARVEDPESPREKPWIAAVDAFAIGGACQWLLVMDHVVAEAGASLTLPARREGVIPGCASLRLPRFVGEARSRAAILLNRGFVAGSPEGRLIAGDVVATSDEVGATVDRVAAELIDAGHTSLLANRRALRAAQEPLPVFRRYLSTYARDQARCLYSPELIANLEAHWERRERA